MQIHTNILISTDLFRAAKIARVYMPKIERKGSRTRDHKWDVNLEGESRRTPNQRVRTGGKAATWDQWGVFLAVLFDLDPNMVCGSSERHAYYNGASDFHSKTNWRFERRAVAGTTYDVPSMIDSYWPDDAHGDHTFRYDGVAREQACTKCSAVDRRWS